MYKQTVKKLEAESSRLLPLMEDMGRKGNLSAFSALRKWQEQSSTGGTTIMLVGTVNAGKSSLLNAVLGNQISPTASKPMTATMMTFVHSPTNQNQKSPRITIQSLSDGERDILLDVDANPAGISEAREFLDEINKNLRDSIFEGDVDEAANSELCTNMPFPYMPQTEVDVVLRDCPGTNEDCSDRIRNRWRSYMHAADVLIVVLDYTQQGSQAEAELFETIVAERGHLHGVLVVVNKADHIGPDLVEYEELRAKTCARVQTYSGKEVSKDCVFFVSATKALIARSIICNSSFKEDNAVFQENFKWLTPLAINTFSNKFKPKPIVKSFSDLEMTLFDWTGLSAEGILEHTHWHDFEHALIRSVVYADAMRVKTGCASILASLHLVSVECKTQITRYRDGVAKNRVEELQRMHQQFLDFVNGEVSDEVEQHYKDLRKLVHNINVDYTAICLSETTQLNDEHSINEAVAFLTKATTSAIHVSASAFSTALDGICQRWQKTISRINEKGLQVFCSSASYTPISFEDPLICFAEIAAILRSARVESGHTQQLVKACIKYENDGGGRIMKNVQLSQKHVVSSEIAFKGGEFKPLCCATGGAHALTVSGGSKTMSFTFKTPEKALTHAYLSLLHQTKYIPHEERAMQGHAEVTVTINGHVLRKRYDPRTLHDVGGPEVLGGKCPARDSWTIPLLKLNQQGGTNVVEISLDQTATTDYCLHEMSVFMTQETTTRPYVSAKDLQALFQDQVRILVTRKHAEAVDAFERILNTQYRVKEVIERHTQTHLAQVNNASTLTIADVKEEVARLAVVVRECTAVTAAVNGVMDEANKIMNESAFKAYIN